MTINEVAYIVGFLDELYDKFSSDGCNDMYLPDTPENRRMYVDSLKNDENCLSVEDSLKVPYLSSSNEKKISTNNQVILRHLRSKLMQEFNLSENDIPDTGNW